MTSQEGRSHGHDRKPETTREVSAWLLLARDRSGWLHLAWTQSNGIGGEAGREVGLVSSQLVDHSWVGTCFAC